MRLFLIFISASFITIFFVACATTPSASDAEKVFSNNLSKRSQGIVRLVDFKKINAQDSEVMRVKVHSIEYEAEIEFHEDCIWKEPNPILDLQQGGVLVQRGQLNMIDASLGWKQAKAGQRETITGTLRFHKTEKGWKGEDGNIY